MKKSIILFVICAQISGTHNRDKTYELKNLPIKPLIIKDEKEDGWGADMRLSIVNITENDSAKVYKAVSSYNNENLGLLVFIPKKKTSDNGFGNGITLRSIGIESDNLLHELAKLYKLKVPSDSKFAGIVLASFVDLGDFAKSIGGGKVVGDNPNLAEYKLFFTTKDDEAELFLNINPTDEWLELSEKDPEYRALIIKVLTR